MYTGKFIAATIIIGSGLFGIATDINNSTHFGVVYFALGVVIALTLPVLVYSTPMKWKLIDYWTRRW
jgi:hypothetical protein